EVIPLLYPIVNGIENDLTVSLILSGDARSTTDPRAASSNTATIDGDFSGSLHWGGIQDVEDANHNILTGWTITSGSGFDYTQPYSVPEAGPSILFAQLFLVVGFCRSGRACR